MQKIEIVSEILVPLKRHLNNLELDVQKASARRRFIKHLDVLIDNHDIDVRELQKKYSEKDKNGDNKIDPLTGHIVFLPENQKKINIEYMNILQSENVIEVTPSNERDIQTISAILQEEHDKFVHEKKGVYSSADYDTLSILERGIQSLKPVESK